VTKMIREASLLTETADYDEPGSWGRMSKGWPGIKGDDAYDMFVFANCAPSIPYGSYVLISQKGQYGARESYLRVHIDHINQLRYDFRSAGNPTPDESVKRRGNASRAKKWW
jgi:hypothetical protein